MRNLSRMDVSCDDSGDEPPPKTIDRGLTSQSPRTPLYRGCYHSGRTPNLSAPLGA